MLASFDFLGDVRRAADDEIRVNTRAAEADQLVLQPSRSPGWSRPPAGEVGQVVFHGVPVNVVIESVGETAFPALRAGGFGPT